MLRPLQYHDVGTLLLDLNHIAGLKRRHRSMLPVNCRYHEKIIPRPSQSDKPLRTGAAPIASNGKGSLPYPTEDTVWQGYEQRYQTGPDGRSDFIAIIQRIAARLFKQGDYEEVFIIEVKNRFDHKWLKFSGN